jgi:hypothetical protein
LVERLVALARRPVASADNQAFDLTVAGFPKGGYNLTIGPNITDLFGNRMDQNGNGVNGEEADQYQDKVRATSGRS